MWLYVVSEWSQFDKVRNSGIRHFFLDKQQFTKLSLPKNGYKEIYDVSFPPGQGFLCTLLVAIVCNFFQFPFFQNEPKFTQSCWSFYVLKLGLQICIIFLYLVNKLKLKKNIR